MTDLITTDRLVLRPFVAEDGSDIAHLIGDLAVCRWLTHVPYPYTQENALEFIARHADEANVYAVTYGGALIGCVSIRQELGYWFGKPFWGQGYATEAARAALSAYFATMDADVRSGYHNGNAASQNVLTKLGFVPDGSEMQTVKSLATDVLTHKMRLTRTAWEAAL